MLSINIAQENRRAKVPKKKTTTKVRFKTALLLSIIFTFIALLFIDKEGLFNSIDLLLNLNRNKVIYNTYTVSFDANFPQSLEEQITNDIQEISYNGKNRFKIVDNNGDIALGISTSEDKEEIFSIDFIPVAHMYSLTDGITTDTLSNYNIYMLDSTFESYLEEQYSISVEVIDTYDNLVSKLAESDSNIALLNFSELNKELKVLELDNNYYLDTYTGAISLKFYSSTIKENDKFILEVFSNSIGIESAKVDDSKLTKLNMSGVVAIARGLTSKMTKLGSTTYPADKLGSFLADADLTHVSNEVSFVAGCTATNSMAFCTKEDYIDVLTKSGVDIVELTGNHNNDYGNKYNTSTINKYTELGIDYFGGGLNKEDASKILYEEVNGTKIAFMGYNYYDTYYNNTAPLAGETTAGANWYSEEKLKNDIATAKSNADIVIVTFQFQECYCYPSSDVIYPICYEPLSNPDQVKVFRHAIDLGATIVVGTQAHQPQTYELYGDGVIFYGLGNLYFDQDNWIGTRQGLILSNYFYDGKYISTKIIPIYMDSSLQPDLATEEQGDLLMELLKDARESI